MAQFSAFMVGGPCDGDEMKRATCPQDGDELVVRGHRYKFDLTKMRWLLMCRVLTKGQS